MTTIREVMSKCAGMYIGITNSGTRNEVLLMVQSASISDCQEAEIKQRYAPDMSYFLPYIYYIILYYIISYYIISYYIILYYISKLSLV